MVNQGEPAIIPKRETPQTTEDDGTVNAKYARFSGPVVRGIVALSAFIALLARILYGGKWEAAALVFALASFALTAMTPKSETLPAIEGETPS